MVKLNSKVYKHQSRQFFCCCIVYFCIKILFKFNNANIYIFIPRRIMVGDIGMVYCPYLCPDFVSSP